MNCWRCNSTQELSIHSHTKKGSVRHICKSCRRDLYYKHDPEAKWSVGGKAQKEWAKYAQTINQRVLNRSNNDEH